MSTSLIRVSVCLVRLSPPTFGLSLAIQENNEGTDALKGKFTVSLLQMVLLFPLVMPGIGLMVIDTRCVSPMHPVAVAVGIILYTTTCEVKVPGARLRISVSVDEFCAVVLSPFTFGLLVAIHVMAEGSEGVMGIFKVTPLHPLILPELIIWGSGNMVALRVWVSRQIPPVMIIV